MSVSISDENDHISMSLDVAGDIIKESRRKPVKATPMRAAKDTGATVKKAQAQSQRASAFNRARGISTTTPKTKNISATNKAKNLAMRARNRRTSSRSPSITTMAVAGTGARARMKRRTSSGGSGATMKKTNPNETLKITVQNNRGPTTAIGNALSGGAHRLQRPLRQGIPRRTQAERHMGLMLQQRSATTDRRAARVSATRGIITQRTHSQSSSSIIRRANGAGNLSLNRANNLRQPRSNPRLNLSSAGVGTPRAFTNGRSTRGGGGGGGGSRDQYGDPFANFRSNRPSNRGPSQNSDYSNYSNSNYSNYSNINDNRNRNNNNNNYNRLNSARNSNPNNNNNNNNNNRNGNKASLNDLFRQQNNTTSSSSSPLPSLYQRHGRQ